MKNLPNSKETILFETKLHWISNIIPIFMMIIGATGIPFTINSIISGGMGIVGLLSFGLTFLFLRGLYSFFMNRSVRVFVTKNYVTLSLGIFSKQISDVPLNKFEGLKLNQNILGKQLDFGTLHISTGGVSHSYQIQQPMEFRRHLIKFNT